jgi:hypothetical protein
MTMVIHMNDFRVATLEQIREFFAGTADVSFSYPADLAQARQSTGDDSKFFRHCDAGEGHEIGDVGAIGALGVRVVDPGEPFGLRRQSGQAKEFRPREQTPVALDGRDLPCGGKRLEAGGRKFGSGHRVLNTR